MRYSWPVVTPTEYIMSRVEIGGVYSYVSAISAVAYTTALYVMVDEGNGGGRAPPIPTSLGYFSIMIECMPESGRCHSVYSVVTPQL